MTPSRTRRMPVRVSADRAALDAITALLIDNVRKGTDPAFGALERILRGTGRKVGHTFRIGRVQVDR